MAIANGMPNVTAIDPRTRFSESLDVPGGIGMTVITSRLKVKVAARKPAKIRIDMRAHGRSRKSPTEVQLPMPANTRNIAAVVITSGALLGGWGCVVSINGDVTTSTARNSANRLPRIATIALTVTPTGLLMGIIYFFSDFSAFRGARFPPAGPA